MREHFLHSCPGVMAMCLMAVVLVNLSALHAGEHCDGMPQADVNATSTAEVCDTTSGKCAVSRLHKDYDQLPSSLVCVLNRDRVGIPQYELFAGPEDVSFAAQFREVTRQTLGRWQLELPHGLGSDDQLIPDQSGVSPNERAVRRREQEEKRRGVGISWFHGPGYMVYAAQVNPFLAIDTQPDSNPDHYVASPADTPTLVELAEQPHASERDADNRHKHEETVARRRLLAIQQQLAELVQEQPNTQAGREAAAIIDAAGFKVGPDGFRGLYPQDTFFSAAAIMQ